MTSTGTSPLLHTSSNFIVNGRSYTCDYETRTTLWEVLSEKLGLTGTVRSCNKATCGVCTVLIEGRPIYSCHYLALEAAGKNIFTIEGISSTAEKLHPLQQIGYKHHAAQCGYCTAGWVVAAKSLLDRNPNPTEGEVRQTLLGHLCRCGAYDPIVRTILEAAESMRRKTTPGGGKPEEDNLPKPDKTVVITQPFERDFATGGGHLPGEWLIEGDKHVKTRKWQGYTPKDTKIVGKPLPPLKQVSLPRYLGKAEYATRVVFPNMLYLRFLRSPHAHAKIVRMDTSEAEMMPGVAAILTYQNAPQVAIPPPSIGMRQEVRREGEIVAVIAAESEDLAEDAAEAIIIDYEVLPSVTTLAQAMAPDAPKVRPDGNLILQTPKSSTYDPHATIRSSHGDVEKGFAESDIVKEFTYVWAGTNILPMQSNSGVAKWEGDKLTYWGYGQDIYATRLNLAKTLGVPEENVRYINTYNGGTFGGTGPLGMALSPLSYYAAFLAKVKGRPVKFALTKEEELLEKRMKSETLSTFKIGAKKDGRIIALRWIHKQVVGDDSNMPSPVPPEVLQTILKTSITNIPFDNLVAYSPKVANWEVLGYLFRAHSNLHGCNRSCIGQEIKWGFEQAIDEIAEALGIDPVAFRVANVARPGEKLIAKEQGMEDSIEAENGTLTFDSFAAAESLEEGARIFGWKPQSGQRRRSSEPSNRFRKGVGVGFSDHLAGSMGYVKGEVGFGSVFSEGNQILKPGYGNAFSSRVEVDKDGFVTIRDALPDSGTDHDTPIAMLVAEILGYSTLDKIIVKWGDSDLAPPSGKWLAGRTTVSAGSAACQAADWIRNELFKMASIELKKEISEMDAHDGVIYDKSDPSRNVTFADLALKAGGTIGSTGEHRLGPTGQAGGRSISRAPGAAFVEVEVDTWTGRVKVLRSLCCTDVGNLINPLTSESDQNGAFIQAMGNTFETIPWDMESHDRLLAGMGYLSYPIPTNAEVPREMTQAFINSFEPRLFFGFKGFSETIVSAIPAAIANAVYDATGIRVRDHPITPAKILEGMRKLLLSQEEARS